VAGALYHEGPLEKPVKQTNRSLNFLLTCIIVFFLAHWIRPIPGTASSSALGVASAVIPHGVIQWNMISAPGDESELESWRGGVGSPLIIIPSERVQQIKSLDSLIVVSWNIHVGGGDLDRFVRNLKEGRLTGGEPVRDFVLLVQEAFRQGSEVPASVAPGARTGASIRCSPPAGERKDIREIARRRDLALYYVPAIRNGEGQGFDVSEDRGNAILSTLMMSSFAAMELPYERQRRLAIAATVSGRTTAGIPWNVRLINVHLENRSRWSRFFASFGQARLRQIVAVLNTFSQTTPTVLGGDFNTWFRGRKESTVRYVEESFAPLQENLPHGTVRYGYLLPERMVDYLFFRLPDGWIGKYRRLADRYGSDHYPLVGRLQIGSFS
jgi:endonuclease/exonuclease/phosphatase family metal-dependent hydrolase